MEEEPFEVALTEFGKASPVGAVRVLPEIDERLVMQKQTVDRGGFRVTKTVETERRQVDEPLKEVTVEIERRTIGLPLVGEPPAAHFEGDTWVIPVVQEVLVTEKRLVLVEEVRVTRKTTERRAAQVVTVRKEHIVVERLAAEPPDSPKKTLDGPST